MKQKLKIALEFLRDHHPFIVNGLHFEEKKNTNTFMITGWSQFINFSNMTKTSSLRELEEIKNAFSKMVAVSEDLENFIEKKSIEYILCYDDGGKTSIGICSEKDGVFKWLIDLE